MRRGDESAPAAMGPTGDCYDRSTIHHLVKKRQTLLEPAQLQGAGIGGDGTVIECSRHAAVAVACCGGFQTTEIWC